EAAGQDFLLGRPALALDEAARDLAGGVGLFLVLHREREEREVADVLGDGHAAQDHRVAEADQDGAGGLAGQATSLDDQRAAREFGFNAMHSRAFSWNEHTNAKRAPRRARSGRPGDLSGA